MSWQVVKELVHFANSSGSEVVHVVQRLEVVAVNKQLQSFLLCFTERVILQRKQHGKIWHDTLMQLNIQDHQSANAAAMDKLLL